jgi:hypothetical protein
MSKRNRRSDCNEDSGDEACGGAALASVRTNVESEDTTELASGPGAQRQDGVQDWLNGCKTTTIDGRSFAYVVVRTLGVLPALVPLLEVVVLLALLLAGVLA